MWHKCEQKLIPKEGGIADWEAWIKRNVPSGVSREIAALDEMSLHTDFVYKGVEGDLRTVIRVVFPRGCIHKGTKWRGKIVKVGDKVYDDREYYSANDSSPDGRCQIMVRDADGKTFWVSVSDWINWSGWQDGQGLLMPVDSVPDTTPTDLPIEAANEVARIKRELGKAKKSERIRAGAESDKDREKRFASAKGK